MALTRLILVDNEDKQYIALLFNVLNLVGAGGGKWGVCRAKGNISLP
jgi:hypothetical protein